MSEQSHALQKRKADAAKRQTKIIRQGIVFGFVGVLNTGVDFLTFILLTHFLSVYYLLAQTLSYGAGMLNSYLWNSKVTFSTSKRSKTRFLKFVVLNVSVLAMTLVVMHFLQFLPLYVNKLISTLIGLVFNFILSKLWVFRV
ncbi:GtrA family protein [Sporolactobacillus pectinivorans]|uniref:GtrA family protein n=1 Tax=Sporolactobacillus pectinivorans TaxID=1591408 RepID=UPI000C25D6FC|nr:GtrA family protein [Sporolactobacillus pectinivorans]